MPDHIHGIINKKLKEKGKRILMRLQDFIPHLILQDQ